MHVFLFIVGMFLAHQVCCAHEPSKAWDVSNDREYTLHQHITYNIYNNHQQYNLYNANHHDNYYNFNHHDNNYTCTQCPECPPIPTNPQTPPQGNRVSRSQNTVGLSENYIAYPTRDLDGFITRGPSSIIGAPTGLTDVTTLTMETDMHITSTVEFTGTTAINGGGNILYLDAGGSLQVDPGSNLAIKNVTIKGVGGNNIFCVDGTGSISVQNVTWVQDSDFTFNQGTFDVMNDFDCIGNGLNFNYTSTQACTVHSGATMTLEYNFTFSYAPVNQSNNLLVLADSTSTIHLVGGSLYAGPGGLSITNGLLFFDGASFIADYAGPGITIGDGTSADDTICIFGTGALVDLTGGSLTYNNVLASSWNMRDINATLTISPGTTFKLLQTLNLGLGNLLLSTQASFQRPTGAQVNGNVSYF